MKDVTSTPFGLLIAFLLPGIAGLYAISLWVETLSEVFATFTTAESNVGLFLLVVLFAIALSLQLNLVRWVMFEKLICRRNKLDLEDFKQLGDEHKLGAFRAVVDEHYRYHQFWGAISVVLPFLLFRWGALYFADATLFAQVVFWISAISMEILTILAARTAYIFYVERATSIMRGA
ncbi:MAG: hypothetical protein IH858_01455 [Chloroflexi bacterium]|nr:hypothetical protein [Chloroflexota bacterium]